MREARLAYETAAEIAAKSAVPSGYTARLRAAAYIAISTGEFPQARRLLDLADKATETWQLSEDEFASSFMKAYLASRTFDHASAIAHQVRALRAAQWVGSRANQIMAQRALTLALVDAGRLREARHQLDRVQLLLSHETTQTGQQIRQLTNRAWLALHGVLTDGGSIDEIAQQMDALLPHLEQGLTSTEAVEFCINRAHIARHRSRHLVTIDWLDRAMSYLGPQVQPSLEQLILQATTLVDLGRYAEAEGLFLRITNSPVLEDQPQFAPEVAWGQAQLHLLRKRPDQARRSAQRAARSFLKLLPTAGTVRDRSALVLGHREFVRQLMAFFIQQGHLNDAFELADGLRSRMLAAWSSRAHLRRLEGASRQRWEQSLSRWRGLKREIQERTEQIRSGSAQGALEAEQLLPELRRAADATLGDALAVLGASRALVGTDSVQSILHDGEAVIMATEAGTSPDDPGPVSIYVDREQVELLGPRRPARHRFIIQATTSSVSLPQWVFEGSWSFIPSAAWLVETRLSSRAQTSPSRPGLIIADPDLTLRGARAEGRMLRDRWPSARLLEGADATLARVRSELRARPAFIHISAHVDVPDNEPERAFIRLHGGERLSVEEFGFLGLPPVPIILTACSATRALELPGGGRLSLGELLLVAGARSVVGPHSLVSDQSGFAFGLEFHERSGLSRPGSVLMSLRNDKRLKMASANFVLLGEP